MRKLSIHTNSSNLRIKKLIRVTEKHQSLETKIFAFQSIPNRKNVKIEPFGIDQEEAPDDCAYYIQGHHLIVFNNQLYKPNAVEEAHEPDRKCPQKIDWFEYIYQSIYMVILS